VNLATVSVHTNPIRPSSGDQQHDHPRQEIRTYALRTPKLSVHARDPRCPAGPDPDAAPWDNLDFLPVLCEDEIAPAANSAARHGSFPPSSPLRGTINLQNPRTSPPTNTNCRAAIAVATLSHCAGCDAAESVRPSGPVGVGQPHMAPSLLHPSSPRRPTSGFRQDLPVLSVWPAATLIHVGSNAREYTNHWC